MFSVLIGYAVTQVNYRYASVITLLLPTYSPILLPHPLPILSSYLVT